MEPCGTPESRLNISTKKESGEEGGTDVFYISSQQLTLIRSDMCVWLETSWGNVFQYKWSLL